MSSMSQADRALSKAVNNVKSQLAESAGGLYISQITGSLMISSELAKSALRSLKAVEENGLWRLPAEEVQPVPVALVPAQVPVVIEAAPVPAVDARPAPAPASKKSMPDKLYDYLMTKPDGVSRNKLLLDLDWTNQQLKDALQSLRKTQQVDATEIAGMAALCLPKDSQTATAPAAAPITTPEPAAAIPVELPAIEADPAPVSAPVIEVAVEVVEQPAPVPVDAAVVDPVTAAIPIADAIVENTPEQEPSEVMDEDIDLARNTPVDATYSAWCWFRKDGGLIVEVPNHAEAIEYAVNKLGGVEDALMNGSTLEWCEVERTYITNFVLKGMFA